MRVEDLETQTIEPGEKRRAMPDLERGATIGRYVILDRIGVGGMGVVYRAFDPDLDRRVALKLVRDLTAEKTTQLVREAQALAKVSHPHIVQIFDVGAFGDTVFIAMELVEGRMLDEWVRETKPAWRAILSHLIDAGRGLAAIHAAGLVHRDFKPANVAVGSDGRVRILDFGLARLAAAFDGTSNTEDELPSGSDSDDTLEDSPATPVADTQDEVGKHLPKIVLSKITGTPAYMAPEQRRRGSIDARADQFAFAVACWELLHGMRPFTGANAKEYAQATRFGRFRPPPAGNRTPNSVRKVLHRALAAEPGDRYPSMTAMLDALAIDPARTKKIVAAAIAVVLIGSIVALVVTRPDATEPCPARYLDGVWDAAVAKKLDAAFAATGAAIAHDTAQKVSRAFDRRADAWTAMHRQACRATRVTGEQSAALLDLRMGCLDRRRDEVRALVDQLVTADAERVAAAVDAVEQLPSVAACANPEALRAVVPPPDDPAKLAAIDRARAELSTVRALVLTGQWVAARDRAEAAQKSIAAIGYAPLDAEAGLLRGTAERSGGKLDVAETVLANAALIAARAHEDGIATKAWSELAWLVGYEDARSVDGLVYASAAEAWATRTDDDEAIAAVAHTRALIYSAKGDRESALREARRAIDLLQKAKLDTTDVFNTIGFVQSDQGDYAAAEATHRRVLAARRAALGDGHPKVADSLDNLGVALFHQSKNAEAKKDYEDALAIRIAALGKDHRDVGTSHNNIGGLLMETGDRAGAEKHLVLALQIYEATLGRDHNDLAIPLSNLGELATERGDYDHALAYCERALAIDEKTGPDDPKLAYDLVCIGEALLGRNDKVRARPVLERALKLRTANEGDAEELARTKRDLERAR